MNRRQISAISLRADVRSGIEVGPRSADLIANALVQRRLYARRRAEARNALDKAESSDKKEHPLWRRPHD